MLVRLEDILLLDLVKGLAALFLCLGVWWHFNLKRMPFSKRVAWTSLFFIQLSVGLGTYWYQTKKYADSEGGDAAALFLNASKLLDVKSKSPVDFWWLIGTGKPKTAVGELAVMHMKIWSKSNHYGLGNEKQRMVRAAALMLWASGKLFLCFLDFCLPLLDGHSRGGNGLKGCIRKCGNKPDMAGAVVVALYPTMDRIAGERKHFAVWDREYFWGNFKGEKPKGVCLSWGFTWNILAF